MYKKLLACGMALLMCGCSAKAAGNDQVSSCCFALLMIGSGSLSVNALFTAGAVVESLSPIVTNFAILVFSFTY